jgi:hypothetical protein
MFGMAPADSAIFIISEVGPVMRDVPESTMPLVGPEEKGPTWTLPMSICQYLGTERGIQAISPVYLASSVFRCWRIGGVVMDSGVGQRVRKKCDMDDI